MSVLTFPHRFPNAKLPGLLSPGEPSSLKESVVNQIPPKRRPLRVLVVDDYGDNLAAQGLLIRIWGHEVATAGDGAAALETAPAFLPDVVLMDIGMPGMDGYETASRLRELPGLSGAAFVAVTGHGMAEDVRRTADAGFDSLMLKPVQPDDLRALLARYAEPARSGGFAVCGACAAESH